MRKKQQLIKVYSHPRSGTHFLEAFLARNFYPNTDLTLKPIPWGHWSNRKVVEEGGPYKQLFGSHRFPSDINVTSKQAMIYIYRDGRAVAYSVWNSDNFIHRKMKGISLSDFLRAELDWEGGPGFKATHSQTIAQHWFHHVDAWHKFRHPNLLFVRYEDLKLDPEKVYSCILKKFYPLKSFLRSIFRGNTTIDKIEKPIGLNPNKAQIDAWKSVFTPEDERFFLESLPRKQYLYGE